MAYPKQPYPNQQPGPPAYNTYPTQQPYYTTPQHPAYNPAIQQRPVHSNVPLQHHTIIVQNQTRPVYVTQAKQSTSQQIAGDLGGAFASAVRSGGQLLGSSKSVGYSVGATAAQAAKSGVRLAGEAAKGFNDELDRTAKSPLLDCFMPGSGIQLISKSGNGCLRCLPDGSIDGKGVLGHDYSCHWLVVNRWENKVILRNGQFSHFHLSMLNGYAVGTGAGDSTSTLKLHETYNHFVRLEHAATRQHISLDGQQKVARHEQYDNTLFDVHLVYSPTGHTYKSKH